MSALDEQVERALIQRGRATRKAVCLEKAREAWEGERDEQDRKLKALREQKEREQNPLIVTCSWADIEVSIDGVKIGPSPLTNRLTTRAVLPDEIDEDPEPEPGALSSMRQMQSDMMRLSQDAQQVGNYTAASRLLRHAAWLARTTLRAEKEEKA